MDKDKMPFEVAEYMDDHLYPIEATVTLFRVIHENFCSTGLDIFGANVKNLDESLMSAINLLESYTSSLRLKINNAYSNHLNDRKETTK